MYECMNDRFVILDDSLADMCRGRLAASCNFLQSRKTPPRLFHGGIYPAAGYHGSSMVDDGSHRHHSRTGSRCVAGIWESIPPDTTSCNRRHSRYGLLYIKNHRLRNSRSSLCMCALCICARRRQAGVFRLGRPLAQITIFDSTTLP